VAEPQILGQQDNFGAVQVLGLNEFIKDIRKAGEKGATDAMIKEANERVAKVVIRMARALANTKQEKKAAASLDTSSSIKQVKVTMGGARVPYAGGANFGSYTDLRRLIKASGNARGRKRATIVRSGESILKVATNVERQFVNRRGMTVSRFEGGEQVKLARDASGRLRVIRGWNQFGAKGQARTQWQKGKDQFLYRAVTLTQDQISKSYQEFIDKMIRDAFPDGASGAAA
jgi:hypothetical protein